MTASPESQDSWITRQFRGTPDVGKSQPRRGASGSALLIEGRIGGGKRRLECWLESIARKHAKRLGRGSTWKGAGAPTDDGWTYPSPEPTWKPRPLPGFCINHSPAWLARSWAQRSEGLSRNCLLGGLLQLCVISPAPSDRDPAERGVCFNSGVASFKFDAVAASSGSWVDAWKGSWNRTLGEGKHGLLCHQWMMEPGHR